MHSVIHILRSIWRERIAEFWLIWVFLTAAVAAGTAWVVGRAENSPMLDSPDAPKSPTRNRSSRASAAIALLALLFVGYVVGSLKWEDFANYDDSYFTLFTLKAKKLGPMIWRENGRFFPLGHQEFNFIGHLTHSVAGYHVLPLAQLFIICCILIGLDQELSLRARALLAVVVLVLPGIVISFMGLIFPERNFVFWLLWTILFVKLFERRRATGWAVGAAVSAQIMVYYKETAFILLLTFAASRLVLRCQERGWERWKDVLRERESALDICFLAIAASFTFYYLAAMYPHANMQYAEDQRHGILEVLSYYLKLDLLAWIFLGLVLRRAYLIARRKTAPDLLWDGLAAGGAVCMLAYFTLRMSSPHFFAPIDLIAVLYVGRWMAISMPTMRLWAKSGAWVLVMVVVLQASFLSAFHIYERKNTIRAKTEIADTLVLRSQQTGTVERLYFPSANVYSITEFSAYLDYRGLYLEGDDSRAKGTPNVILGGDAFLQDGSCVPYRSFICHAGHGPAPGDLVIQLPDDDNSSVTPGILLFSYQPWPRIPETLHFALRYCRIASFAFRHKQLPPGWLKASVTKV